MPIVLVIVCAQITEPRLPKVSKPGRNDSRIEFACFMMKRKEFIQRSWRIGHCYVFSSFMFSPYRQESESPSKAKRYNSITGVGMVFDIVQGDIIHSIDSLYSTNSVNVYVPSDNQQFWYKIARGW